MMNSVMKITTHIKNLSEKLSKEDAKRTQYPAGAAYLAEELTRVKNAMLKGNFYVGVKHVSRSGMSRTLSLAYIYKNRLQTIHHPAILGLAGCNADGRIGGCGMDMCFAAQYNLFCNLFRSYKEAHYQKRMPTYNSL